AADASLEVAYALAEPLAQFTVGLMSQPEPGQLNGDRAGAAVAGLADALLTAALPAIEGCSGQSDIAGELTTVVEVAVEYLVDHHPGANWADAFELSKLRDLRR